MTGGRIAVLGGAGFLGSHLVDRLTAEGRSILVVDDLSSGRLDNLADARRKGRVGFHNLSVDHQGFGAALVRFAPAVVYLLADPTFPDGGIASPVEAASSSVARVVSIAEAALACDARIVLGVSALDLYGAIARQPVQESQRPHPLHPRGASTYAALRYVEARLGRDWCGVALSVVYGPRQRPESALLPQAIVDMIHRHPPVVAQDPAAAHDWLYIDDAVDALARAASAGQGLVNVGSGIATPVADVMSLAADAAAYLGNISFVPSPLPVPAELRLDSRIAFDRLGWRSWTPLGEGLARTVAWLGDELA